MIMDPTKVGLLVVGVAIIFIMMRFKSREGFAAAGGVTCPVSANRGPDGRIHVQPGDKSFATMQEYVSYLSDLYATGATCIPPKVIPNREPVAGLFGGGGNGAEPPQAAQMQGALRDITMDTAGETTSANTPIKKLDDYEYTRVFETERSARNDISPESKSKLMSDRLLDWASLPFNSEKRAGAEDEFISGVQESGFVEPKSGVFFNNVSGKPLDPPDVEAEKLREQKVLAAYRPTDISTHTIDSETEAVGKLVHTMYASDPNWEPVVTKVDENNYQVTELRPKARKEKFEEESTMKLSMAEEKGFAIPPPSIDITDRMRDDPYFDKNGLGDRDNNRFWNYNDFRKWTPGLERMFAPTSDIKEWH